MSLDRQFTYLFGRGFTGGPCIEESENYHLDFDDISLEIALPRSHLIAEDMSQKVNFPFRMPGWFDRHSRQLGNHVYIPALVHAWTYSGPFWKVLNEPLGVLSARVWLKKVNAGHALSIDDLSVLERAIHSDYKDHLEAIGSDKKSMGLNTIVRRDAEEMFRPRPHPTSRDLIAEKERYLSQYLQEIPEKFERRDCGNRSWVYYRLERESSGPTAYYCYPLDERFYLNIVFHCRVDFNQHFHLWKSHAEDAEQRIMNSVRLTFPGSY